MKTTVSVQKSCAAAGHEASRRALAAILVGQPSTYHRNRMILLQEMARMPLLEEARALHQIFAGLEAHDIGPLITGATLPAGQSTPNVLEPQAPMILQTGKNKTAVFNITDLGILAPADDWLAEIAGADKVQAGINSPGGCCGVARRVVDAVAGKESVCTITRAYSAAALISQVFTTRKIFASGIMMFHPPTAHAIGTPAQIRDAANFVEGLDDFWVGLVCSRSQLPASKVRAWFEAGDHYFTAKEALDLGLVDEIIPDAVAPSPAEPDGTRAPIPHPDNSIEVLTRTILGRLKSTFQDKARYRAIVEEFAVR